MAGLGGAEKLRGRGHEVVAADGGQRPGGEAGGPGGQARAGGQGGVDNSAQGAWGYEISLVLCCCCVVDYLEDVEMN